jgi:diguanylate cyclase (GGDEF)-like protein/PAS domain S-box-containing protein
MRAKDLAEDMLRRSESRLQSIIDSSRDWIWECDREGRFTFSSPSVLEILGYGHHEILGQRATQYVDPADEVMLQSTLGESNERAAEGATVMMRWRHKSGRARWLERTAVALRDDNGELVGLRGIDRDVTVRRAQDVRIRRLNRALRFLSGASSAVMRMREREQLLREACRLAVSVGGYARATIYLLPSQRDGEPTACGYGREPSGAQWTTAHRLPDESTAAGRALASGSAVLIADLADETDQRISSDVRESALAAGLRSSIALPLAIDGTSIGALELHTDEVGLFGEAELALLKQVTANITFSLQYLHSKESAEYFEYFDPLTSLPNRSLYQHRLEAALGEALRDGRRLALLVLDVADLSIVNDGLGHHAGDLVLQLIAERLKNEFRDPNSLCRLAGDRFAVLAVESSAEAALLLQQRVAALFVEPFSVHNRELRVSIRAGLAQSADDGADAEALLQQATTALQHAKLVGEPYLHHSPAMSAGASERLRVISELRRAVAGRQFNLHYQPKVDLATGRVEGVEGLLRWPGAPAAAATPNLFVPMLESLGLIEEVGAWVVAQALEETDGWFTGRAGFRVAINVSPLQLQRESFADRVLELAAQVPDGAHRLELEITESTLMVDPRRASASLGRLRAAGVSIAIDDFGTGHSSLRVLAGLPVDVLKIDRSFVRDVVTNSSNRSIVQATIMLAASLGLRTVAEGVEDLQQVEVLRELGCSAIQGYLVRRPGAAEDVTRWLATADNDATSCLIKADARGPATGSAILARWRDPRSSSGS